MKEFRFPCRWIAYFDILGFSEMLKKLRSNEYRFSILGIYKEALKKQDSQIASTPFIGRVHFSDTFIFYTKGNSRADYAWIQSIAKNFMRGCLREEIPIRGAIAVGDFYVNEKQKIYIGGALVEAHEEAESQDWIGLILTRNAEKIIKRYKLNPARHNFHSTIVPRKAEPRYAYTFYPGDEQIFESLRRMQVEAPKWAKDKYSRTIEHILNSKRKDS